MAIDLRYEPAPTAEVFHRDVESRFKFLRGPVGGGKTTACIIDMFLISMRQAPDALGQRRTRWLVVRNQYPTLKSTVIKSFEEWLGGMAKVVFDSPIRARINETLPDGTRLDIEFLFIALDDERAIPKLRGLEVTAAYISEASEIPEEIIEMIETRINRYPAVDKTRGSEGATWSGIIAESNPPSVNSWIYRRFEIERPEGHVMYAQPPALLWDPDNEHYIPNPAAENIKYLAKGYDYYLDQVKTARPEFIKVYVMGEYGVTFDGRPVFPQFTQAKHVSKAPLQQVSGPLVAGIDFGLTPGAVLTQMNAQGQLVVLDELAPSDVTLEAFVTEHFLPMVRERFGHAPLFVVGDPAGSQRSALGTMNSFQMLRSFNIPCAPAPTNDISMRLQAVSYFLDRENGFLIDPKCKDLIDAMSGAYRYKKRSKEFDATWKDTPEKNKASHIVDSLQYAALYWWRGDKNHDVTGRNFNRQPSRGGDGLQSPPRKKFRYA